MLQTGGNTLSNRFSFARLTGGILREGVQDENLSPLSALVKSSKEFVQVVCVDLEHVSLANFVNFAESSYCIGDNHGV